MLILSRKTSESIIIDGRILVKIVRIEGGMVKVGIDAPADVPVHRQEVFDEIQRNNQEAITHSRPSLPKVKVSLASPEAPAAKPQSAINTISSASTDGDSQRADAVRLRKSRTNPNPRT